MHTTRWFRAADAIPMIVCVAAAVALLIAQVSAKTGAQAVVKTPTGETYLSLSEDGEWEFVGKDGLTVTVTVKDGAVAVTDADCPDHVCVHAGHLTKSGSSAVCVPAEISVTVEGERALDAVSR